MSSIGLLIAPDSTSILLDGHMIFTSADRDHANATFKVITHDLESLRTTVRKMMNSIKTQSDLSPVVRQAKCEELESALENAGVPMCDEVFELDFEGFVLKLGVNREPAEWHTNSPEFFEIVSATHRGADATEFINTIGPANVWDKLACMIDNEFGRKK
jgi:hypothetical protein